jgi:hypothetical protein
MRSPNVVLSSIALAIVVTVLPPFGPRAEASQACSRLWYKVPRPELAAQLQAALEGAGIAGATVSAEAAGERCYNEETGEVRGPGITNRVHARVPVDDVSDAEALGTLAATMADVAIPVLVDAADDIVTSDLTTASRPADVSVSFVSPDERRDFKTRLPDLQAAREQGLTGAALIEALGATP